MLWLHCRRISYPLWRIPPFQTSRWRRMEPERRLAAREKLSGNNTDDKHLFPNPSDAQWPTVPKLLMYWFHPRCYTSNWLSTAFLTHALWRPGLEKSWWPRVCWTPKRDRVQEGTQKTRYWPSSRRDRLSSKLWALTTEHGSRSFSGKFHTSVCRCF